MRLRIAIKNIFRHRTRSIVTLTAIGFGATSIIFAGGFFEDVFFKLQETFIKTISGHIQIYGAGFYEEGAAQPFDYMISEPDNVIALIKGIPGVSAVTPRIQFSGLIGTGETSSGCIGIGLEPNKMRVLKLADATSAKQAQLLPSQGTVIESGDELKDGSPFSVIIGRGLAKSIKAKVGDDLVLLSRTTQGSINGLDVKVAGIFLTGQKDFDDHVLQLPLATSQQLLRTTAVQSLVVMLDDTRNTARIKKEIERRFKENDLRLEAIGWEDVSDYYAKTKALFSRMFLVLKLVIVVIVLLSINNTMMIAVSERTVEIGTLRAIGDRASDIVKLFLCEGAALGVIGGLIGVAVGAGLTWAVGRIGIPMPPAPGCNVMWLSEPAVIPSALAAAFTLSLAAAVASAVYPAVRASRLEIAQALRHAN